MQKYIMATISTSFSFYLDFISDLFLCNRLIFNELVAFQTDFLLIFY